MSKIEFSLAVIDMFFFFEVKCLILTPQLVVHSRKKKEQKSSLSSYGIELLCDFIHV